VEDDMVDSVSGLLKGANVGFDRQKNSDSVANDVAGEKASNVSEKRGESSEDVVELSSAVRQELDRSGFDQNKVEQIKNAIAEGTYPIDGKRVAENFAAIEKLI